MLRGIVELESSGSFAQYWVQLFLTYLVLKLVIGLLDLHINRIQDTIQATYNDKREKYIAYLVLFEDVPEDLVGYLEDEGDVCFMVGGHVNLINDTKLRKNHAVDMNS